MPNVWRERGFRFFFYSEERNEPPHVHVASGHGYAKIWLGPPVVFAASSDYGPRDLRTVIEIVRQQRELMEKAWYDHFGT